MTITATPPATMKKPKGPSDAAAVRDRLLYEDDDCGDGQQGRQNTAQRASVSAVQRRFRVGYSRAGRINDALKPKGAVGPYEGSKSRPVVATSVIRFWAS
jgi:DNA segregation ATPase FtsK/SpoIIIE-like protein